MTYKFPAVTKPAPMKAAGLRLGPLVAVMYFTVSGGPFGLEGLVGSVGPGVAVLLLVATPLVYSVPEALLIGELASMLPVEGGYYQWVKRDRKSTRLNSSHGYISYAVFCLKKKKKEPPGIGHISASLQYSP